MPEPSIARLGAGALGLLVLAGCGGSSDRPIKPHDQATVNSAVSTLTAPPGYQSEAACSVVKSTCFRSALMLSEPVATEARALLQRFGLVVEAKDVNCSTTRSSASAISHCEAFGSIGKVEFAVSVTSTHSAAHGSLPQGTQVVFTPTRIRG